MLWREHLRAIRLSLKRNIALYKGIHNDPRTPRSARILLWTALAYTLSPIDLIPDFVPIIGHLDDAVIIPLLVYFAIKLVPREVYEEHRNKAMGKYPRADA